MIYISNEDTKIDVLYLYEKGVMLKKQFDIGIYV